MEIYIILMLMFRSIITTEIHLDENNKLNDMLIYVNDNVDDTGELLEKIQDHFTRASLSLLKATGNMKSRKAGVQFGTVFIRVPATWNVNASPVSWQQCNKADFYITTSRDNDNSDAPFTKQLGKCGEPGSFTRLPESFFKNKTERDMISAGRKIMNEFVKLRYGVFSEKPRGNVLMIMDGDEYVSSTCGKDIKLKINKDPLDCIEPNKKCTYEIIPNQQHTYSVMFDTDSDKSDFFCDNDARYHNKYAYNLQNHKCEMKSVSSVILKHSDFKLSKRSKAHQNIKFEIVRGQGRKIALVLDTSGSMENIIENMKSAVSTFVSKIVENSSNVGLVEFNTNAKIVSVLLPMNIPSNRMKLVNIIEKLVSDGSTNIPDGLAKGIEILGSNITSDEKVFGSILLLTDGENNQNQPYLFDYAMNQVIKKGILVNAIAYGTDADSQISTLATATGGKYFFDDTTNNVALLDKFSVSQNCESPVGKEIKVMEGKVKFDSNAEVSEQNLTYIDKYVGVDVKISYEMSSNANLYTVTLIGPSNQTYPVKENVTQGTASTLIFLIPGKAEEGFYRIRIKKNKSRFKRSTNEVTVKFWISATPESKSPRIIVPTGELSQSQIENLTDTTTVLANVDLTTCGISPDEIITVTLVMETPESTKTEIPMKDDGMGGDVTAGDKFYGVELFPKDLGSLGFYNFQAIVNIQNNGTKEIIKRTVVLNSLRVIAKQSLPIQDKISPEKVEIIKLSMNDMKKRILKVRIYATGNDGMVGNISFYQTMINSSTITIFNVSLYASPRDVVEFELDLTNVEMMNKFETSVRGIDNEDNIGEWSIPKPFNWNYKAIVQRLIDKSRSKIVTFSCIMVLFSCIFSLGQL